MARIRTIKPEFWTDSKVVGLSPLARLLFIGAWNFADDYGALPADPMELKLKILPAEPCNAEDLVDELLKARALVETSNGHETFWVIRSWEKHQKVDKRSSSHFGDPDSWSPIDPSESPAESRRVLATEGKGREGKGEPLSVPDGTDDEFDTFWNAYPRHHDTKATGGGGNKRTARKRFRSLSATERAEVLEAVVPYGKLCRPNGQKPKHAERFLINEAWQPYLPAARAGPPKSELCRLCDRPLAAEDHDALCEVMR